MATDGGGTADPSQSNPSVLYALALGRLAIDSNTGDLDPEHHILLGDNLATASPQHTQLQPIKKVRNHLRQIMKKGGHKLTPGKRLRLRNEEDGYDVHILGDALQDLPNTTQPVTLIFFVLTVPEFSKYYPIANVLRDYTAATYTEIPAQSLATDAPKSIQPHLPPVFSRILLQYQQSPLRTVESKVASVKSIMSHSVAQALNSVEQLEDMEEQTERLQEHTKQFQKKSQAVKEKHRRSYYFLLILLVIFVIIVALYFIIPAATSGSSSSTLHSSSSSTGSGR